MSKARNETAVGGTGGTTTFAKLPGVLAFSRCHIVTDGLMYNRINGSYEAHPVQVVRHGIRGTQNVSDADTGESARAAKSGEREVSNIQQTETAKLLPGATALVVTFDVAMLDLDSSLDSCVGVDRSEAARFRETLGGFIERAKGSEGLLEVARRYARNVLNGRWLWRNRSIASSIMIEARRGGVELANATFERAQLVHFNNYSPAEEALALEFARQLRGESLGGVSVTAELALRTPGAVEVFPSQNYIENKPKGFARPLYKIGQPEPVRNGDVISGRVMGQAALRDQKISNALRTIDTWYPAYAEVMLPLAVEPLGASLSQQAFYRKGKASAFDLFKRLGQIDPSSEEGMFCIACIDRGGVYGESDKALKEKAKVAREKDAGAEEIVE